MEEIKWYVLGSLSRNQELKIRDDLRRDSYDCFVPLRYVVKTIKGHRQRTMVPALSGLMFIKGSLEELKEVLPYKKYGLYLRKSTFTNKEEYLTVSDHDMQNFIAVTEKAGEKITYYSPDEIQLRPGDKIRVSGGLYDGREGMIMRVKGKRKKQFVVSIPGILIASVELESDLVEVLSDKSQLSKNIYEDQRLLIKLAKRLLFDIPEAYQHEKEYYLMLSEMKHVASRLSSVKAYIPSREAEFALPLYLAAVKLQQDVESTEQRLHTAIDKLQPTSLLKLRCQMYLAHFSGDADLQIFVEDRIATIKSQPLSINQRLLLEEFESLQNSHKIV
jgi:transcription antitermination factor NusG